MKNILKITASLLILFNGFMTADSLAVLQPKHKIGFVKAEKDSGYGPTWYWFAGNKNMNASEVILYVDRDNSTLINIDGQDILLNKIYVRSNSSGIIKVAEYKSLLFRVKLKDFKDITTAKDRKGCMRRVRGFLEIIGNDGWRKKLQVDSGEDVCG